MSGNSGLLLLHTLDSVGVAARRSSAVVPISIQPKRLALLVYLALYPSRFCRRDRLVALFWPELDHQHARGALRQAVRGLRRSLGAEALVTHGEEEVGVAADRLWCDALAFEAEAVAGRLTEALELYRGDFLAGFFVDDAAPELDFWVDQTRTRLQSRAREAAGHLLEAAEHRGDHVGAVAWARRTMELVPDDERGVRRLIRLLDARGDRAGALGAYEAFRKQLSAGHGVEPSPETLELIAQVRSRTQRVWESPLRGWPPGPPPVG
jgi:DNA-binding SARP family transcriptional activator